jgi:hypothetical protein
MSWGFKSLEAITSPSVTAFSTLDPAHPGFLRPTELRDYHEAAAVLSLPASVPECVRGYFDAVRMLWVYGWFYYPFYSLATIHSGLCVEMALKERFQLEGLVLTRETRRLKNLLEEATRRRWIVPDGFTTIRRRKENENFWLEMDADIDDEAPGPKLDIVEQESRLEEGMQRLLDNMREFRNRGAHPTALPLRLPGMTYTRLEFARDLIAQLFGTPA